MAGLIGSALPQTDQATPNPAQNTIAAPAVTPGTTAGGNTVYGADTATMTPTTRSVDQPTETVAGQLHTLLAGDSPYIQQARSQALDTANSRGLLNSSMAAGAGESAAIGAALPVAQSDAGTYTNVANANQGYKNAADQINVSATNASNLNTAQAANTSQLSGQAAQQDTALQTLKGQQAQTLATIEAQYKDTMQASASAAQIFSQFSTSIGKILDDPNTSTAQKQTAVDAQNQMLQDALAVQGGITGLDLGSLLNFEGAR